MIDALVFAHAAGIAVGTGALWLLPRINRDTLPFGVRVPPERATAPQVVAVTRDYRRVVLALGLLSCGLSGVLWPLLPAAPIMGSTGALLAAGVIVAYLRAHHVLRRAKAREGWYAGLRQGVATDTGLRTEPVPVPWWGAVPSLLAVAATAVTGAVMYPDLPEELVIGVRYHEGGAEPTMVATTAMSAFGPVLIQALLTAALLLMLRFTMRARADIDAARPRTSAERHRRFLRIWARCLLGGVFAHNVALGMLALLVWNGSLVDASPAAAALVVVPILAAGALLPGAALLIGQGGWRLRGTPEDTGYVQRDDDRHWRLAGLVYVNRRDPGLLVPKRTAGFGWTVNVGHPAAWLVLGLVTASVVALAVLGATGGLGESTHYGWQF